MSSGGRSSSSRGGSGNNNSYNNGVGVRSIPPCSKEIVQNLKEIVNFPEQEIYAMLKECNMDPNDAVQRLLSQDTFHEVKSKKEKKKEIKDTSEFQTRGFSTNSSRGSRGGASHHDGRGGSHFISSDFVSSRGKSLYKKENGVNDLSSSSTSAAAVPGNNTNRHPISFSDSFSGENKLQTTAPGDSISSSLRVSPAFQPAWKGVPGQVSMADIVKMGRPRASNTPVTSTGTSHSLHNTAAPITSRQTVKQPPVPSFQPLESNHELGSSRQSASKGSEMIHEAGIAVSHHGPHDEWPLVEQSSVSGSSILDPHATSVVYADSSLSSNLHMDRTQRHSNSAESQGSKGDIPVENYEANYVGSASALSRQIQEDFGEDASHFDGDTVVDVNSYHPHGHTFEQKEGTGGSSQLSIPNHSLSSADYATVAVSSAAAELQNLSLQKEEVEAPPAEVNPAVILPNHLQMPTADCSHLSFGSFGSGLNATNHGSLASKSLKSDLEESSVSTNVTSSDHPVTRNPEYFGDEHLRPTSDGNVAPRAGAGSYDSPPSQPETVKQDTSEITHDHQYAFPTSVPAYALDSNAQSNAPFNYSQTNSQMQNIAPLSSLQGYTNSLQGNLLASMVPPVRESDLAYSQFLATQSMPTKYSSALSSISAPTSSMPEIAKSSVLSVPQPSSQNLTGTSIATGPALPQHLLHAYSPTLPLGHFANLYPFMPQSYYMPSAFQQPYAGNSTYHQSPAAVHNAGMKYTLSQYKNSVSGNSLTQPTALPSGYGGFESSTNIPGSFQLNPSANPASTTIAYDDVISSQYKDGNHYVPIQQNDNSTLWVHGGSRTVSAVPPSTYYSIQGQSQHHNGYRQGQESSQHYGGALGYPNFYNSQAGVSHEHQQQIPNDVALGSSQVQPNKQTHQIWQHNY